MTDILFNIAAINTCTSAEGPWERLAIWFQGCNIGCNGCCNTNFQSLESKHIVELKDLVKIISRSLCDNDIEGVTYLGGEPTLQTNLPLLSKEIHDMGLGIILFTGRMVSEMSPEMLAYIDLVVDGRFDETKPDNNRNMIGSTNQNIIIQTDRYNNVIHWFTKHRPKKVDVNFSDSIATFTGDVL